MAFDIDTATQLGGFSRHSYIIILYIYKVILFDNEEYVIHLLICYRLVLERLEQ